MQGLLSQVVQWYSQKRESSSLEANFIKKENKIGELGLTRNVGV